MELQIILNQMAVLFILMAVGFGLGKLNVLTQEGNKILSRIILFLALPALIITAVLDTEITITISSTLVFLLISFLTIFVGILIAYPLIRLLGGDKANRGLLCYMSVFGNTAYMGIPVVIAIFGFSAAFYAALFNIAFSILTFSFGIMMVSKDGRKFNPKLLLNPTLIISILAIPLTLGNVTFPLPIAQALRLTGSLTTPTAMLVIGSTLSFVPIKTVLSEWRVMPMTLLKLVVVPVVTWLIFRLFITDEMLLGILVVLSAMPTAVAASMIAIEYGSDEQLASAGVFLTTLLCGITVPLLLWFIFI